MGTVEGMGAYFYVALRWSLRQTILVRIISPEHKVVGSRHYMAAVNYRFSSHHAPLLFYSRDYSIYSETVRGSIGQKAGMDVRPIPERKSHGRACTTDGWMVVWLKAARFHGGDKRGEGLCTVP